MEAKGAVRCPGKGARWQCAGSWFWQAIAASKRREGGEGKEAGQCHYQAVKLRRRLNVRKRQQNGGAPCGSESSKGGGELGFARRGAAAAASMGVKGSWGCYLWGGRGRPRHAGPGLHGEACADWTWARVRAWLEVEEGSDGRTPPNGKREGEKRGAKQVGRGGVAGQVRGWLGQLGWAAREEKRVGEREKE